MNSRSGFQRFGFFIAVGGPLFQDAPDQVVLNLVCKGPRFAGALPKRRRFGQELFSLRCICHGCYPWLRMRITLYLTKPLLGVFEKLFKDSARLRIPHEI